MTMVAPRDARVVKAVPKPAQPADLVPTDAYEVFWTAEDSFLPPRQDGNKPQAPPRPGSAYREFLDR